MLMGIWLFQRRHSHDHVDCSLFAHGSVCACPVWTWGNRKKWGRGLAVGGPGGFGLGTPPPTAGVPAIIGFFPARGPEPL